MLVQLDFSWIRCVDVRLGHLSTKGLVYLRVSIKSIFKLSYYDLLLYFTNLYRFFNTIININVK